MGGEFHTAGILKAACFRQSEERQLAIVLRRGLTCQDYGESLSADAHRMMAHARKLNNQIQDILSLIRATEHEADEYAGTSLLFVLGEGESEEQLKIIQTLKRRTAYIDHLCAGAQALARSVESRLSIGAQAGAGEESESYTDPVGNEAEVIKDLQDDLSAIAKEGPIERGLLGLREEISTIGKKLQRKMSARKAILLILKDLLVKIEELGTRRDEIEKLSTTKEAALATSKGRASILENAKRERSRVEVLNQIMRAGRGRNASDLMRKRVADRYLKLMQRNIENRLSRVSVYANRRNEITDRIQKIKKKLWEEFQVPIPQHILGNEPPPESIVEGRFEAGIWLCSFRHQLEDRRQNERGVLLTEDSQGQTIQYQRTPHGTIAPIA